jgi:hypothetical protein
VARRNGHKHASLYDFRDLDLMLTLEERGDAEGWASVTSCARLAFGSAGCVAMGWSNIATSPSHSGD